MLWQAKYWVSGDGHPLNEKGAKIQRSPVAKLRTRWIQ
jgi:hypothetical protein